MDRTVGLLAAVVAVTSMLCIGSFFAGGFAGDDTDSDRCAYDVQGVGLYAGPEVTDNDTVKYLGSQENTLYFETGNVKTVLRACPAISGRGVEATQTMTISQSSVEEITESVENGTSYAIRSGQGLTGLGWSVEVCVLGSGGGAGYNFTWDNGDTTRTDYYSYIKSITRGVSSTDEYSSEITFSNMDPDRYYRIAMVVEFTIVEAVTVTDAENGQYEVSFLALVVGEYIETQSSRDPGFKYDGSGSDCSMTEQEIRSAIDSHMAVLTPPKEVFTVTFSGEGLETITLVGKAGESYEVPGIVTIEDVIFEGWSSADGTVPNGVFEGNYAFTARFRPSEFAGYTPISLAADFRNISNDMSGKYYLTADIDLGSWNGLGTWNGGYTPFTGILDGNGHTVTYEFNGTPNASGAKGRDMGLITCLRGTVEDLKIHASVHVDKSYSDKNWNTLSSVGGLAGLIDGGTVRDCEVSGTIATDSDKHWHMQAAVGGIAGRSAGYVNISGCKVSAVLTADGSAAYAGGIVGYVAGGTLNVSKVLVTGNVYAWGSCKGGFLWVKDGLSGCDAFCSGRHDSNAGGVIGAVEGSNTKVYVDNVFITPSRITAGASNYIDAGAVIGRCYSGHTYTECCIYAKGILFENDSMQNNRVIDGGNNSDQGSTSTTPGIVLERANMVIG